MLFFTVWYSCIDKLVFLIFNPIMEISIYHKLTQVYFSSCTSIHYLSITSIYIFKAVLGKPSISRFLFIFFVLLHIDYRYKILVNIYICYALKLKRPCHNIKFSYFCNLHNTNTDELWINLLFVVTEFIVLNNEGSNISFCKSYMD